MKLLLALLIAAATAAAATTGGNDVCMEGYPRQYVTHKLQPGESIVVDGKLDEAAWAAVADIGPLSDIEGAANPSKRPYLSTSAKVRWDADYLFLGVFLEEPNAWATPGRPDNTPVYLDNDFEMFVDVAGSARCYKELEMGTGGAQWNLLMVRPYSDGGPAVCNASATTPDICAKSDPEHGVLSPYDISQRGMRWAVHVDGALNDPTKGSRSWTLEAAFPLARLADYSPTPVAIPPKHGDLWRANFMRVQWHVHSETLPNGTSVYVKDAGVPCENWAWNPTRVVNIHLPERWGYLEFSEASPSIHQNATLDALWPLRRALEGLYLSEKAYKAIYIHGYTANIDALVSNAWLPEYVAQGKCASIPKITLTAGGGFVGKVASLDGKFAAQITDDRLFTYTTQ